MRHKLVLYLGSILEIIFSWQLSLLKGTLTNISLPDASLKLTLKRLMTLLTGIL